MVFSVLYLSRVDRFGQPRGKILIAAAEAGVLSHQKNVNSASFSAFRSLLPILLLLPLLAGVHGGEVGEPRSPVLQLIEVEVGVGFGVEGGETSGRRRPASLEQEGEARVRKSARSVILRLSKSARGGGKGMRRRRRGRKRSGKMMRRRGRMRSGKMMRRRGKMRSGKMMRR